MTSAAISSLAEECGLIPLYHASFAAPPVAIVNGLHNVSPDGIYRHLSALKTHFRFVSIDEFVEAKDTRGLASVTFDDGYRCVIEEALPVFESLNIPFTVFVNGVSLGGGVFWRDKVRYMETRGWVDEFLTFAPDAITPVAGKRFYRYSKHPRNNSRAVDLAMDAFFANKGVDIEPVQYCFDRVKQMRAHPLVSYGNHTYHHYVLSSLEVVEQSEEVAKTQALLQSIPGITISSVFSIPFGDVGDFNDHTLSAIVDHGYTAAVLSRQRCHKAIWHKSGVDLFERFMAREGGIAQTLAVTGCD